MKKLSALLLIVFLLSNSAPAFALDTNPSISGLSTTTLTPGETILTITGEDFGGMFNAMENEICFGNDCYNAGTLLNNYLESWSNTEITLLVPDTIPTEDNAIRLRAYFSDTASFEYIQSAETYTVEITPEPVPDANQLPQITSFSPELFFPGDTIIVSGNDFGDTYTAGQNSICLGDLCMDDPEILSYLVGWSNNEIDFIVPDNIAEPGKLKIKAYSSANSGYVYAESSENFHVIPAITSFSPQSFTPGETVVTINGYEFGSSYVNGSNQVCFGIDSCITDLYINDYLQSWTDTKIQVLVPEFVYQPAQLMLVLNLPTTAEYGMVTSENNFSLNEAPALDDPAINSISPSVIIAEETEVTVTGSGFGDAYEIGINQICFNDDCIADSGISYYLESWSDTKVKFFVPYFVSEGSITVSLRVYMPSTGLYDFIESSSVSVKSKPIIEWYYTPMYQGTSYTYTGTNFGASTGKVVINGVEAEIEDWSNTEVTFRVPDNASSGNIYIESADGVKSQELAVGIIEVTVYSNDEFSFYQWNLGAVNAERAWEITEGSSDVVVAVIDSGVDITHEDLKNSIWKNADEIANNGIDDDGNGYIDDVKGWDFLLNNNSTAPRSEHGTMVASVIAAEKDNVVGIAGIAPKSKIMALNVSNNDGYTINVDAAILAIKYAVDNGADIINLSFGGTDIDAYFENIIQYAHDNNVLVVASSGNEGLNLDTYSTYAPVCVDLMVNAVIGIASSDIYNIASYFTNYGKNCVDLTAPGEAIPVAVPSEYGYYNLGDGTSFSAPLVSGIAALIKAEHPTWNVEEIKQVLLDSATSIDNLNPNYRNSLGQGIPDAYAALTAGKPNVDYTYNPDAEVEITETDAEIEIEIPETNPIEQEPVQDDSTIDDRSEKNTDNTFYSTTFEDVWGHKYEVAIAYLQTNGIVSGYPDGTFKPDNEINRAEFTKIVIGAMYSNIFGTYCFPDVQTDWFAPYVCTAQRFSVISGYPDGTFKPDKTINTVEALKIIITAAGYNPTAQPGEDWFKPYVDYATTNDLAFILSENTLDQNVTRAQMAELIYQTVK